MHPEVVERTAEDLERQPVQVKGVPVSGLWGTITYGNTSVRLDHLKNLNFVAVVMVKMPNLVIALNELYLSRR